MQININKANNEATISIIGRLDTTSAPELEKVVTEPLTGVTSLIFDLGQLEYTSSAGLRVFLQAQKLMNRQGEMKLTHVSEAVMEIFDITGFTDIMTIE